MFVMSQPLNPLTLPLSGSWLIEASAGTGKTYTLAALYVRLALGHGPDDGARLPALSPSQILVMTFTEAAAGELRDRIRQRLTGLADWLRRRPGRRSRRLQPGFAGRGWTKPTAWAANKRRRLALAADLLDDAAISPSTAGAFFFACCASTRCTAAICLTKAWTATTARLMPTACATTGAPLSIRCPDADFAAVAVHWATSDQLADALRPLLGELPGAARRLAWARWRWRAGVSTACKAAALKTGWPERVAELRARFADWQALPRRITATARAPPPWQTAGRAGGLGQPAASGAAGRQPGLEPLVARLLGGHLKGDGPPPCEPPDRAGDAAHQLAALTPFHHGVLAHASQWLGHVLDAHKRREAVMDFDDLLIRLDQAADRRQPPDPEQRGWLSGPFASGFRRRWWMSFRTPTRASTASSMRCTRWPRRTLRHAAGDDWRPKQAIYAFRGGDIFTYLTARAAAHDRHVTLDQFRSTGTSGGAGEHSCSPAPRARPGGICLLLRRRGRAAIAVSAGARRQPGNPSPPGRAAAGGPQGGWTPSR